jgi:ABC-2 type transport system permease protein
MTELNLAPRPIGTGPRRVLSIYVALAKMELQAAAAYRAQLLLGALGWVVPVGFMALWRGAAAAGPVDGVSAAQFTTYFAIVLLTSSMQIGRDIAFEISPKIHSGELSALLLRPHHPLHSLVAKGIAQWVYRLTPLLLVVPLLIVVIGGTATSSAGQWLLAGVLGLLGTVGETYLGAMMGCVALWWTRSAGIRGLLFGAEWVLGGLVAPVVLLPGVFADIVRHQPLWYAIGAPGEAVSGITVLTPWVLLEAAAWIVVLHLLFARIWRRGMRRFEAVGT